MGTEAKINWMRNMNTPRGGDSHRSGYQIGLMIARSIGVTVAEWLKAAARDKSAIPSSMPTPLAALLQSSGMEMPDAWSGWRVGIAQVRILPVHTDRSFTTRCCGFSGKQCDGHHHGADGARDPTSHWRASV